MIPRHGAIRRPQSNHNRDKIGTAGAGSPDTEGPAQSGPAQFSYVRLVTAGSWSAGQGSAPAACSLGLAVPVPALGLAEVGRALAVLAVPHAAPLAALLGRVGFVLAAVAVPYAAFGLAEIGRVLAGLAVPNPTLLLALIGGIGERRAGLALVVPHPALGLAGFGRGQASVLPLAVPPQPFCLHSSAGLVGGRQVLRLSFHSQPFSLQASAGAEAALAVPDPALLLAFAGGVDRRDATSILVALVALLAHALALRDCARSFGPGSHCGAVGATQRPFWSRS